MTDIAHQRLGSSFPQGSLFIPSVPDVDSLIDYLVSPH